MKIKVVTKAINIKLEIIPCVSYAKGRTTPIKEILSDRDNCSIWIDYDFFLKFGLVNFLTFRIKNSFPRIFLKQFLRPGLTKLVLVYDL